MITNSESNRDCKSKSRLQEQGDSIPQLGEINGFNLPTLFGDTEDVTNYELDVDDFKYSDLFDENGEVYADTLWSSVDHGAMTVRNEHRCLMFLFDVYTVSTLSSPFGPLTVMSAPPPHHRGAHPKTTGPPIDISYACVACPIKDFKTAHSLRRHMVRIHNLACDTLVQGRPFPHVGYTMRRPNAKELHDFPRTVFPDDWAVSHREDIDPEAVSDRPPFGHRFVGIWPDIKCVPITNADGTDNFFGRNRSVIPLRCERPITSSKVISKCCVPEALVRNDNVIHQVSTRIKNTMIRSPVTGKCLAVLNLVGHRHTGGSTLTTKLKLLRM